MGLLYIIPCSEEEKEQIQITQGSNPSIMLKSYGLPRILRAMINRMRQISFRLDKKCGKGRGEVQVDSCVENIEGGKAILDTINRQYQVIENVCSIN